MGAAYLRLLERLETTRVLGVDFGLDRLRAALDALGNPHQRLPAVHIAGTNGKGSTAAMTEAVLRAAGLRTGLYTSPHLSRFTERIRIDGQEIDGDVLAAFDVGVAGTGVPLTYFEVATVLAFCAMAEAAVDVAVLEVGLGGRLDATNVCVPLATAITSIGLDHTDLLGPDLASIAREKAGIAKPGVPLLVGRLPPEAASAVKGVALAAGAPTSWLGREVPPAPIEPALRGEHQRDNAALAVALARLAAAGLGHVLPDDAIARGLRDVHWPGRLEQVASDVLLDAAHNPDGARTLVAALPPGRPRALVTSVVRGKDARTLLALLVPHFDRVFVTRSANPRALPPDELRAELPDGQGAEVVADPRVALAQARAAVGASGQVVVAGSMFLVGEVRAHILAEPVDPVLGGDPLP